MYIQKGKFENKKMTHTLCVAINFFKCMWVFVGNCFPARTQHFGCLLSVLVCMCVSVSQHCDHGHSVGCGGGSWRIDGSNNGLKLLNMTNLRCTCEAVCMMAR